MLKYATTNPNTRLACLFSLTSLLSVLSLSLPSLLFASLDSRALFRLLCLCLYLNVDLSALSFFLPGFGRLGATHIPWSLSGSRTPLSRRSLVSFISLYSLLPHVYVCPCVCLAMFPSVYPALSAPATFHARASFRPGLVSAPFPPGLRLVLPCLDSRCVFADLFSPCLHCI